MSIRDGIRDYYPIGGVRAMAALVQARVFRNTPEIAVNVPGIKYRVRLRVRTTDAEMFTQVLVVREYELPFSAAPNVIIDAGANVGYTSVFYANKYPQTKIFAIEPAASNFRMLVKNTAKYENVVPIHAALWSTCGNIAITGLEFGHCGFRVSDNFKSAGETVAAITIQSVIEQYGIEFVDILKLDIEGAEKEVLEGSDAWID